MISDKDRELLAVLGQDARAPTASIARRLGLSRTTVQSRIEKLERDGIIAGYGVRLSKDYESALVKAHVLITIESKMLAHVTAGLLAITEVRTVHSVSGSFDLIAIVSASSIAELDHLIDRVGMIEGVERTLSSIILSTRVDR